RVLAWVLERCAGRGGASDGAIGYLPRPQDLPIAGLGLSAEALAELTLVPAEALRAEVVSIRTYLKAQGERVPAALYAELDELEQRLRN
ncbi:MAG: phosphoenolpyruvate carboxykinase domain-containing protein, partial [Steroidobacteraceae bacterium]